MLLTCASLVQILQHCLVYRPHLLYTSANMYRVIFNHTMHTPNTTLLLRPTHTDMQLHTFWMHLGVAANSHTSDTLVHSSMLHLNRACVWLGYHSRRGYNSRGRRVHQQCGLGHTPLCSERLLLLCVWWGVTWWFSCGGTKKTPMCMYDHAQSMYTCMVEDRGHVFPHRPHPTPQQIQGGEKQLYYLALYFRHNH